MYTNQGTAAHIAHLAREILKANVGDHCNGLTTVEAMGLATQFAASEKIVEQLLKIANRLKT